MGFLAVFTTFILFWFVHICSLAADFLPTFMYCMGSGNFDVVQTALRNLPEYVLLCQGEREHPQKLTKALKSHEIVQELRLMRLTPFSVNTCKLQMYFDENF